MSRYDEDDIYVKGSPSGSGSGTFFLVVVALVCVWFIIHAWRMKTVERYEYTWMTVVQLGDCTNPIASDGYLIQGKCRAILDQPGYRITLDRPVLVGDKVKMCRTVVREKTSKKLLEVISDYEPCR